MKQFYKNTINKLFLNKDYFSSMLNRYEILLEKKQRKEHAVYNLSLVALLAFNAIALVAGLLLGAMAVAGLSIGFSWVAFIALGLGLEIVEPFEKKNLRDVEEKFATDISQNPELLKDIYKLCIDKDATFKFNWLIDNVMHNKKDFAALQIFYKIMDNYELHEEISKSNPVRELFITQLKIKEPSETVEILATGK
jgi:hypothetical protein